MEEWAPIGGWEGYYEVSNMGRIRSLDRTKVDKSTVIHMSGQIMRLSHHVRGYLSVSLSKNGVAQKYLVHRLVASVFVSNQNGLNQVNHIDGNKKNNCATNLNWVTAKENTLHAIDSGLHNNKGVRHYCAKLTEDKVIEIRRRSERDGMTQKEIARIYSLGQNTVSKIITRKTWKHI